MARTYLRAEPARKLRIELDEVRGRSLPGAAEQHALGILERDLDKPDGIVVDHDDLLEPAGRMAGGGGDASYTFAEMRSIARSARDGSSEGSVATLHVVIIDGAAEEVPSALGIAIGASTIIIFADQIDDASGPVVGSVQIWRAVTVHEFGHVLGLVELVEESRTQRHADPAHRGHSPSRDSVMYWAVEDIGIASLITGGPPNDFDADDRADLAALRT
jgi:hypothetical protein